MQTSKGKIINKKFTKGFTLLELLVVVIIIGILTAIALPQYQRATAKANLTSVISYVKPVAEAQERYFLTNGKYTNDSTLLDVDVPSVNISCRILNFGTWCISPKGLIYLQWVQNYSQSPKGQTWCASQNEKYDDVCKNLFPQAIEYTGEINAWFPQLNVHKGWRVK